MTTIITLVIVLSILIFAHEFGHFITAKIFGARVEEFGFGFPPRIFGVKKGDTIYSINWIPLGGFVKISGEIGGDKKDPGNFSNKPAWKRAIVMGAGVIMNLVLAWFLLTIGFIIGLPAATDDLPAHAKVSQRQVQIYSVLPDSAAGRAGLEAGDKILEFNGEPLLSTEVFSAYTTAEEGREVELTYTSGTETKTTTLVTGAIKETGKPGVGLGIVETGIVSFPVWLAPIQGAGAVAYFMTEILAAFGGLIRDLVISKPVAVEFSGPVGIAVLTGEVAALGFRYLLQFIALLSVNLAIINILPFPALDGGRLLFLAIEKIRRRPVSAKIEAAVHNIGFALLMLLVLVITYRDIIRFSDRFKGIFGGG